MTNYLSITKFESKVAPGVIYTIRKMSHGRRVKLNIAAAAQISKVSELQRKLVPISEEIQRAEEAAKNEPCQCKHSLDPADPAINEALGRIANINKGQLEDGKKIIEVVDVCHSALTKRCMVNSCNCRKPMPDEGIGGYDARQDVIQKIIETEDRELTPMYIKYLVTDIQGLQIDGVDATADSLLENAHESLVEELSKEIQRIVKLTPDEALGFKPPITSDAAVVDQAELTTAP